MCEDPAGLEEIRLSAVPAPSVRTQSDLERAKVAEIPYASIVGALLYIAVTSRPDIAYHTSVLAKFLADPSPECCEAAYHLPRC